MEPNTKENLVEVSAKEVCNKPFKLLSEKSFESIKTSFEYYKLTKKSPMIGRWDAGQFQIYDNSTKSWTTANFNDYQYDADFVTKKNGVDVVEKRKKNYFETRFSYIIEFKDEESLPNKYNPATKAKETMKVKRAKLLLPRTVHKMIEAILDSEKARPGTNVLGQFYKLTALGVGINTRYTFCFHSIDQNAKLPTQPAKPAISLGGTTSLMNMQFTNKEDGKSYSLSSIISALKDARATNEVAVETLIAQFGVPRDKAESAVKLA